MLSLRTLGAGLVVALAVFAIGQDRRGGAATPQARTQSGPEAETQAQLMPKTVTWTYIRMNDREAVNALVRDSGRGARTVSLVPPYLSGRLSAARGLAATRRPGNSTPNRSDDPSLVGKKPIDAAAWSELFKPVGKVSATLDFGEIAYQPKATINRHFWGVATNSGKLIVQKPAGPFRVAIVRIYNGNVANGTAQLAKMEFVPSQPQLFVGAEMPAKLREIERRLAAASRRGG